MNKRLIFLGVIILIISVVGKLILTGLKHIKVDDFHPSSVIFVVDSSASNQNMLEEQIKYLKSICTILDPEDSIKILKVSESSYLIYEGSPSDTVAINKTLNEFTKYNSQEYGTAYGEALNKAFEHAKTMKREGFIPSVVVIGDLENEGDVEKQINWNKLPEDVKKVQDIIPEFSMMFAYAHPQKLDVVKTKLAPILGEKKLVIVNEKTVQNSQRKLLEAIGR